MTKTHENTKIRHWELRAVTYSATLSEETANFRAALYCDGRKVADVGNDGHGGPNWSRAVSGVDASGQYADLLREALRRGRAPWMEELDVDPTVDSFLGDLFSRWLATRDLTRDLRRTVVFTKIGDAGLFELRVPRGMDKAARAQWLAASIPRVAAQKSTDKVLNAIEFHRALDLYEAALAGAKA